MKIGIISDTHSYLDPQFKTYFKDCDQLWHAGDIGSMEVADQLEAFKPTIFVYGNIDDQKMRIRYPKNQIFECAGLKVFMTHIGGYPPNYKPEIRKELDEIKPRIFVCGHSHILKIMPDQKRNLIHFNSGAAGKHGFHHIRTLIRLEINNAKITNVEVIELGKRGTITDEDEKIL